MNARSLFALCFLLLAGPGIAVAATIEDFARHSEFTNVKISPDGKHLAVLMNDDSQLSLAFLRLKDRKPIYALKSDDDDYPINYYWVNDERVVVEIGKRSGALTSPSPSGELFAVNVDGSQSRMIAGYRSKEGTALGANGYFVKDILEDDKNYILASKRSLSRSGPGINKIVKLNVYNGKELEVERSPISYGRFLLDNDGKARFAWGVDSDYTLKLFYQGEDDSDWQLFKDEKAGDFQPVAFNADNSSVYALYSNDGSPQGLYRYDLENGNSAELFRSELASPTQSLQSGVNQVYGLRLDEDYPTYLFLNDDSKMAKVHRALVSAFNGDIVDITSSTRDAANLIVRVSSDRNPGSYYLVNADKLSATPLMKARSWLKPDDLAATEPFRIKTPDGLVLNGYLTLPKRASKDLPMVVMPHGGPHARDYWGFDNYVQMLADAGYAVVQVNFRGSTGYGKSFEEAGWGEWGGKIQDDITLATRYMIQSGVADPKRICILGASFGGYSAIQSAIREPDLYQCAVGYVGVYDLPMMYNEGDITEVTWGDAFLDKTLGTSTEEHIKQSPSHNVGELKAALFLVHGAQDQRAPLKHAQALRNALDKHGYPYKWMVKENEGHGFYDEDNIVELFTEIRAFLNKHIGA